MPQQHVIIGGGPVATNAVETIRQFESEPSSITLVCDEPPHSRMALPYWLSGQIPREQTHTGDADYFQKLNVDARIGTRATAIDTAGKQVTLDDGSSLAFDNLLLATGSSPIRPPIDGLDLDGVQPLWTLEQTQQLLDRVGNTAQPHVLMIGAGFIGFIMLNAMHKRGWKLTVVEREPHVLPTMLDDGAAGLVQNWLAEQSVDVRCGVTAKAISETADGRRRVTLDSGDEIEVDAVVVAVGVQPNLQLVDGSGIDTDHGILVDSHLQTSVAGVYAGGDVAQGPALYADDRQIHAIQPTAVDHGRVAGANMAGHAVDYPGSLQMNVLDVCGLQNASFGNWQGSGDELVISSPETRVYRKLIWDGDRLTGAVFVGRANDLGMLTDVGMVKGILQTGTPLGKWKDYLRDNPFDVRRPYVALQVAGKLAGTTLLGKPAQPRQYRHGNAQLQPATTAHHQLFVSTKTN